MQIFETIENRPCSEVSSLTLPETNKSLLKIDGWKTICFHFGAQKWLIFNGKPLVLGRVVRQAPLLEATLLHTSGAPKHVLSSHMLKVSVGKNVDMARWWQLKPFYFHPENWGNDPI